MFIIISRSFYSCLFSGHRLTFCEVHEHYRSPIDMNDQFLIPRPKPAKSGRTGHQDDGMDDFRPQYLDRYVGEPSIDGFSNPPLARMSQLYPDMRGLAARSPNTKNTQMISAIGAPHSGDLEYLGDDNFVSKEPRSNTSDTILESAGAEISQPMSNKIDTETKKDSQDVEISGVKHTASCNKGCLITVSVIVTIISGGLIAAITLMILGPCQFSVCTHGYCDENISTLREPLCVCEENWAGAQCDEAIQANISESGISFAWSDVSSDSDRGWKVTYEENNNYPDVQTRYTRDMSTTFTNIKPTTTYHLTVYTIDWLHQMNVIEDEYQQVQNEQSLTVTWTNESLGFGYFVKVSRVSSEKSGTIFLSSQVQQIAIEDLESCTSYAVRVYKILSNLNEEYKIGINQKTDGCNIAAWQVGQSIIIGGWSGGGTPMLSTHHCNQPDSFPWPVFSPSCPEKDQSTGKVGEAITNIVAHTGRQSWHYKRGHNKQAHGSGAPYSPELAFQAGRSDAGYTGDADGFYASIWFRAAGIPGDGSSIEIAGGDHSGTDRISTMVFVTANQLGIDLETYDCHWDTCVALENCGDEYFPVPLGSDLPLREWHHLELELRVVEEKYGDRWTYIVDGVKIHETGAYLNAWTMEYKQLYNNVNRLKFKPRNDPNNDIQYKGFYFDDIRYEVFNWDQRNNILDSYETSFEFT